MSINQNIMSQEKITAEQLERNLCMFTGTEEYHRFSPLWPNVLLTDGAKYLAEKAQAYWFMDVIGSVIKCTKGIEQYWMLNCFLKVNLENNTAVVTVTDGNKKELYKQNISYTDFPLAEVNVYCNSDDGGKTRVILLPSEY